MLIFTVITIFISVALLAGAALYPMLSRRDAVRERVAKLVQQEREQAGLMPTRNKWQVMLADVGGKLRMKQADLRTYREMVTAAGFRKESVYIFLGSKLLLAVALPSAYVTMFALPNVKMTSSTSMMIVIAAAISGYLLPTFWLSHRAENRKTEIFHSLPDILDLLTVCVEAGLSLDAGLMKTTENYQNKNDPLIKEIQMVTLEVRAGKPRSEALKGLAERTMVEDIKSFVSMLIQTEKFGTSLGKTLRTYSDSLRMKRNQLAEERAAKTAVKMLIPLTFCVFPALLVVMLAPAFFKIYAMFDKG